MENLKLIRKVKKMSNRQFQMSREAQGSTSARMPYDFYDSFLDESNNPNKEGLNVIFLSSLKCLIYYFII